MKKNKYARPSKVKWYHKLRPLHLVLCIITGLVATGFGYDAIIHAGAYGFIPLVIIGVYVIMANLYLLVRKAKREK